MCHLCRKIEVIRGIDSKATKPILVALSKLHKHAEPRLGDLWLWRHDETLKLRKLLGGLHKTVPLASLKAMLEDIDHDIDHIKKNMADHPPRRSTGRWNSLKTSITPSESPSIMVCKEIQLEAERRKRDKQTQKVYSKSRNDTRRDSDEKALPELPGSDINPPGTRIQQSFELVEEWFWRCDVLMRVEGGKDTDNRSIVSIVGGGVKERPDVDVGVWRKGSLRNWKERSNIVSSIHSSRPYKTPITQLSNCVYNKPPHKLDLNLRIVGKVAELAGRKAKYRYQNNLSSLLQRKKAEKLSKRQNISVNLAIQRLQARQGRKDRKYLMSGGRSTGPTPITSLESIANSSQARTSIDSSTAGLVSLTTSEVERCIVKVGGGTKMDHDSNQGSSSLKKSHPSPTNSGSLIEWSPSVRRENTSEYQERNQPVRVSSSFLSSRLSVVNLGSLLNQKISSKDQLLQRASQPEQPISNAAQRIGPSSRQHRPASPVPIGRVLSPISMKSSLQLWKDNEKIRRHHFPQAVYNEGEYSKSGEKKSHASNSPPQGRNTVTKSGTEIIYKSGDYQLSKAVENRNRRRTERNEATLKETTQERKELPRSKTSDRELRTPRTIINPDYVRTEAREVSQAVKDSRRRRAAQNSRVPATDRFRNEERRKFWNSVKP